MDFVQFIKLLKQKKKTVFSFMMIFLLISLVFTLIQPLKYSAKSRLLVIQENTFGSDPYAISRSNEYLSNLFSAVAYSSSFFRLVMESNPNIDKNYFGSTSSEQMKMWTNTIETKPMSNTGIIVVSAYHKDRYQAREIAMAVDEVLMTKNSNYQGMGAMVKVSMIDDPIISNYPVKPNIILNLILAIILGVIFGVIYVYLIFEPTMNHSYHDGHGQRKYSPEDIEKMGSISNLK